MNIWSRHRFCTGYVDARGRVYLSEREPFAYRPLADNRVWHASEGDSLFSIADRMFGGLVGAPGLEDPSQLFWVIADYQPDPPPDWAADPTRRIPPGALVIVPSLRTVRELVFNEGRRREHEA